MVFSAKDVVEILQTLDEFGYQRFRFEQGDVRLEVDATGTSDAPPPALAQRIPTAETVEPAVAAEEPVAAPTAEMTTAPPREGLVSVDSPMTGTFYRASSPSTPPFVEVGNIVAADDTVCLVDVMKLFNSIPAGVAGTVVDICAENEAQVKAGQPLMWIEPSS
jgi:acetyl-CoA carboxylase biotin carboxyl carrier protein